MASRDSYRYKPNVVLINAGTNDANQGLQNGAGSRMEALIRDLWAADGMQDTLVILSSVLPRTEQPGATNLISINAQVCLTEACDYLDTHLGSKTA